MITKLINPFRYLAGTRALILGLAAILATAVIGYFSKTNFPDVISTKVGYSQPLYIGIINNLCNWIALSSILYIASLIFSKSKVRPIDVFGTQALARFPYLLVSTTGFAWNALGVDLKKSLSPVEITIIIPILLISVMLTVWLVVLMYNAFRESSNIKGNKSILIYTVSLLLAVALSILLSKGIASLIA